MHDVFIIKELCQHILSFIPRKIIMPCVLTCKKFYNSIPIDLDQESVTINSDIFSLLQITYSPKAVINIAKKHGNIDMIEYLLKYELDTLKDINTNYFIGYIGNEELLDKLDLQQLDSAMVGICEGMHVNLIEKYKKYLRYNGNKSDIIKFAYKINNGDILQKVIPNADYESEYSRDAILIGLCAQKNANDVITYIKLIIENKMYESTISNICDGLIEGEHYDIFEWFVNEQIVKDNGGYECWNDGIMENLIQNNNFKFFTYVILNYCKKWNFEGYNFIIKQPYPYEADDCLDFRYLVDCCIDYKRTEILLFLIDHITFNMRHYQKFLNKAKLLGFDDIENLLVLHLHKFKDYDDSRDANEKFLHNWS